MSDPVMIFEKVIDNFKSVKEDPNGTLYAFRFPWSFADGAKIRLMPPDKKQHLDCLITGCYKSLVRHGDWSIEFQR